MKIRHLIADHRSLPSYAPLVLAAGALCVIGGILFIYSHEDAVDEIAALEASDTLQERQHWYRVLIERVGPYEAQQRLHDSDVPFDGFAHLTNHMAGEYLYEHQGAEGLLGCKDYFAGSCYHGFIISALSQDGVAEVEDIMAACAQRGSLAVTQCSHALGHGFLAWEGYTNLLGALHLCETVVGAAGDNGSPFHCYDGVFMENIWGIHEGGELSTQRWVREGDYLYPCSHADLSEEQRGACWANQPSLLYQMTQGGGGAVAKTCASLVSDSDREYCFGGLAHQLHTVAAGDVGRVFSLCEEASSAYPWLAVCLRTIADSFFVMGDLEKAYEICEMTGSEGRRGCYQHLFDRMPFVFSGDKNEQAEACALIKDEELRWQCFR